MWFGTLTRNKTILTWEIDWLTQKLRPKKKNKIKFSSNTTNDSRLSRMQQKYTNIHMRGLEEFGTGKWIDFGFFWPAPTPFSLISSFQSPPVSSSL